MKRAPSIRTLSMFLAVILASLGLMIPLEAHVGEGTPNVPILLRYANGSLIRQVYIQSPQMRAAPPSSGPLAFNLVQSLCEKQAPLAEPGFKLRPKLVTRLFAGVGAMLQGQTVHPVAANGPTAEKLAIFDFDLYCDEVPVANANRTVLVQDGRTLAIRDRNVPVGLTKPAMPLQPIAHTAAWPMLVRDSQETVARLYPGKSPRVIADASSGHARLVFWPDLREKKLLPAWTMTIRSENRSQPFLRRYYVTAAQPVRILDFEDLIFYEQQPQILPPTQPQPRYAGIGGFLNLPNLGLLPGRMSSPRSTAEPPSSAGGSTGTMFGGTAAGTVTAAVWETSPYGRVVTRPMPGLDIMVARSIGPAHTATTNSAGQYSVSGVNGMTTLSASLSGPSCRVVNDQAKGKTEDLATFDKSNAGVVNVSFPANQMEESKLAQTTAFYSVTQAHDFVRSFMPERGAKLSRLVTHVNLDSSCNAYYDRSDGTLNFFSKGSGEGKTCPNTAYSDVIYHEYGHAVDDELGGIVDSAYSEGFGDCLAMLMTRAPFVGRDFYGPGNHLRDSRKMVYWPKVKDGEIHEAGQTYAGFCWELTQQLSAVYGSDRAFEVCRQLIMGAAVQNPKDIPDAVRLTFFVDAQLYPSGAGSQHAPYLRAAAQSRQLPIPSNAFNLSSPALY